MTADLFVHVWIAVIAVCGVGWGLLSRHSFAPIVAMIAISYMMFGYSTITLFFSSDLRHWFDTPPPASVSRVTLTAIVLLCCSCLYRAHFLTLKLNTAQLTLGAVLILIFPILTLTYHFTRTLIVPEVFSIQFKFSLLFSFFFITAFSCALLLLASDFFYANSKFLLFSLAYFLLSIPLAFAVGEIALDIGPVRNFFFGDIETRASSTFHNPNWFAICTGPVAFFSGIAAVERRPFHAILLSALCTAALVMSGSRSTMLLMSICATVLGLCLAFGGKDGRCALLQIARTSFVGFFLGIFLLWILMQTLGVVASARYQMLLDRAFLWPARLFSEPVMDSIWGRLELTDGASVFGSGVVDNAYLYLWEFNPWAAIALVVGMTLLVIVTGTVWGRKRNFYNALHLSLAIFVALTGAIGQVYWAFPVWIVLALITGYIFAGLISLTPS